MFTSDKLKILYGISQQRIFGDIAYQVRYDRLCPRFRGHSQNAYLRSPKIFGDIATIEVIKKLLVILDFDLTVSIVHPMGGGLQLVFFGYPSERGIRKGQSCSSTLLRYYGTANYMLPLETHINQGYPLWFVAISGHINTQINSNRVNYTGILECIVKKLANILSNRC